MEDAGHMTMLIRSTPSQDIAKYLPATVTATTTHTIDHIADLDSNATARNIACETD